MGNPGSNILQTLRIPKFHPSITTHSELAGLSRLAHRSALIGEIDRLTQIQQEIDESAATIWGIDEKELIVMRQTLEELLG